MIDDDLAAAVATKEADWRSFRTMCDAFQRMATNPEAACAAARLLIDISAARIDRYDTALRRRFGFDFRQPGPATPRSMTPAEINEFKTARAQIIVWFGPSQMLDAIFTRVPPPTSAEDPLWLTCLASMLDEMRARIAVVAAEEARAPALEPAPLAALTAVSGMLASMISLDNHPDLKAIYARDVDDHPPRRVLLSRLPASTLLALAESDSPEWAAWDPSQGLVELRRRVARDLARELDQPMLTDKQRQRWGEQEEARLDRNRDATEAADLIAATTLSPRERQVIRLFLENYSPREIAAELGIDPTTVPEYKKRAIKKLARAAKN
jgi:RNA polymerase sigma factor (sigma-70 family)